MKINNVMPNQQPLLQEMSLQVPKRDLVDESLRAHLKPLLDTQEYCMVAQLVASLEDKEIALGELAQRSGEERRTRMDVARIPGQVAQAIQPRFDEARERELDARFHGALHQGARRWYPLDSVALHAERLRVAACRAVE